MSDWISNKDKVFFIKEYYNKHERGFMNTYSLVLSYKCSPEKRPKIRVLDDFINQQMEEMGIADGVEEWENSLLNFIYNYISAGVKVELLNELTVYTRKWKDYDTSANFSRLKYPIIYDGTVYFGEYTEV